MLFSYNYAIATVDHRLSRHQSMMMGVRITFIASSAAFIGFGISTAVVLVAGVIPAKNVAQLDEPEVAAQTARKISIQDRLILG